MYIKLEWIRPPWTRCYPTVPFSQAAPVLPVSPCRLCRWQNLWDHCQLLSAFRIWPLPLCSPEASAVLEAAWCYRLREDGGRKPSTSTRIILGNKTHCVPAFVNRHAITIMKGPSHRWQHRGLGGQLHAVFANKHISCGPKCCRNIPLDTPYIMSPAVHTLRKHDVACSQNGASVKMRPKLSRLHEDI